MTTPKRQKSLSGLSGNLIHRPAGRVAVKSVDGNSRYKSQDGWLEGYLVTWGSDSDTDLQGEFFTPRTEFCLDWFKDRPVLYHHGLDGTAGLRKIGTIKAVQSDDMGLWVQAQLDLRDRYAMHVYDMVKSSDFGWSSGSVDHLVKVANTGEITVWPIIEGSITPTPAQPSKTTVRPFRGKATSIYSSVPSVTMQAFKSVVADDHSFSRELTKLEARMKSTPTTNAYKAQQEARSIRNVAAKLARSLGMRSEDVNDVAMQLNDITKNMSRTEALRLETDAERAIDDINTKTNEENRTMARRRRSSGRRRSYRTSGNDMGSVMGDELSIHADDISAEMADEMAAEMEEEIKSQLEELKAEERAKRAFARRAWSRAIRQLEATDDTMANISGSGISHDASGAGLMGDTSHTNPPTDNFKRRRRGYRSNDMDSMQAEQEIKQLEESVMAEEIARQSYENGMRTGMRRAFRTTDTQEQADTSIAEKRRRSYRSESATEEAEKRARRRRARRARRSRRSTTEDSMMSDSYMSDDFDAVAMEEAEKRARRRRARRSRRRGYRSEDAMSMDETEKRARRRRGYRSEDATATDEAEKRRRRSYRSALRRARRSRGEDAMAMDDAEKRYRSSAYATTEEDAMASEGEYGSTKSASYWMNRARQLERQEAGGERSFGRIKSVTDVADRAGAYTNAFKSYLYKGDRWMSETEKYVLQGKGKVDWSDAQGTFGRSGYKSYKTYFGGSDASAGFSVPPDWVSELNKNVMTQTVMAPECRTRVTTSDRIVQPSVITTDGRRAHAAQVRWPGEEISSGSVHRTVEDSYSQVNVPVHVMLMSLTAGNSALEDATFDLEAEINEAFSEAVAISYDELIWGGDGQGKLEGIVTNPEVTGTESTGVVTPSGFVKTGSGSGIPTADVLKTMLFHLPNQFRSKAKWYMNSNTGLEIATLKNGEGDYLIDQRSAALSDNGGVPATLLGRPVVYNEYADDIADGNFPIVLGDLSRGYLIGKRVDFSIQRFDDSQYAELDQVLYLGRARVGGQVLQPSSMKVMKVSA